MEINGINNSYGATQESTGMLKDDFLKLFTLQLRFQDPLSPMNGAEFTSQLAQFSSLEQLSNLNMQFGDLLLYQNSLQNTLATSLIGKEVKISGNEVYLSDEAEINYNLSEDASEVKLTIYDSEGNSVREVEIGQQTSGDQSYVWDGRDSNGNTLPEGQYEFKVEAFDASGNSVDTSTMTYGTVTGITFDNNITYLILDGTMRVQMSEIVEINQGGV